VCNIDTMSVSFKIDEAFGEPLLTSRMRWTAGPNTSETCLSKVTYIWLRARTPDDKLVYVKLSPDILTSGDEYGSTATESPNWSSLFCDEPNDTSSCETADEARNLYSGNIKFEGFEVTTEARTLAGLDQPGDHTDDKKDASNAADLKLENMLARAVDQAIAPVLKKDDAPKPPPPKPQLTPQEIAAKQLEARTRQAKEAVDTIVTLIGSSLAQFTAPPHACESKRVVANWVQARGTCQLNFRSEANHQFLCSDDGTPKALKATRSANIDLTRDLSRVDPIRVSNQGWASIVLELNGAIRTTTEGNYKTNRWQITADADKLPDLERLASSILTLKQYCETPGPST